MDWSFWADMIFKLWTVALTLYIAVNKGFANIKFRADTIEKDLNGLGSRVTKVEESIRMGPTHEHLGQIHDKINAVAISLGELTGQMKENAKHTDDMLRIILNRLTKNAP